MTAITRTARRQSRSNPENTVTPLSLFNAFNKVSRAAFVGLIEEHFPELASWMWRCYGAKQLLLLKGQEPLFSAAGVQQGDPLVLSLLPCSASSPQEVGKECCSIGLHG